MDLSEMQTRAAELEQQISALPGFRQELCAKLFAGSG